MPAPATEIELDGQYRALREEAGWVDRSDRGKLLVRGSESGEYLQGQLTNDVEGLEPGRGCYAALLNRKGHLVGDMRVLLLGSPGDAPELWLDLEPVTTEAVRRHLDTYKIGREVEVADETDAWAITSVIGPAASERSGTGPLSPEHAQGYEERDGIEVLAVATDTGVDLVTRAERAGALRERLESAGVEPVSTQAAEIVRIESGRPRFGLEMDSGTMPAEAGIVKRAVDFDKGCYIGQEPVARLHYRGRPNRRLVGLRLSAPAEASAPIALGEREVGKIGSACISPAHGPIALAIIRREAELGARVVVDGGAEAEVTELPFA
jgi:folate-binding protein YgfZ